VLNGTGAPPVSLGHDGDFYIDTAADVLYGPKTSGTWPTVGTSLVGPAGSPGKGATVASLAAGDTHCGTGGASITDGSGNTAYACNGAQGNTGPAGPPGPPGTSFFDYGQVVISSDASGTYTCSIAGWQGPDAPGLNVSAQGPDTCSISGFPPGTFVFEITPFGESPAIGTTVTAFEGLSPGALSFGCNGANCPNLNGHYMVLVLPG
jgi:hypothetical protein